MDKKYADKNYYQSKLEKIMIKLKAEKYNYHWSDKDAYIRFKYKGKWYELKHTLENANKYRTSDNKLKYGSDIFAQLVLTLEDLQRMDEYNIYDLSDWLSKMQVYFKNELPDCFQKLGFIGYVIPTEEQINTRFLEFMRVLKPENYFGDNDKYEELKEIKKECLKYIEEKKKDPYNK